MIKTKQLGRFSVAEYLKAHLKEVSFFSFYRLKT